MKIKLFTSYDYFDTINYISFEMRRIVMNYNIAPFSDIWADGIFNVPSSFIDRYLRIASEYQLKALLFILRNGGACSSADIAKALGQTASDIEELMEFWVEEGILADSSKREAQKPVEKVIKKEKPVSVKQTLAVPRLSPKDIVAAARDNASIAYLLNDAQTVLGRTISHAEQEMLVNMVNYYGLPAEVIMMLLEFYRSEKEKGRSIGISYINQMAKNWSEEGIDTVTAAEEKLIGIERSDRLWSEVVAITGIRHRRPTQKQRDMVNRWFEDFDITMITAASDIMKENIPEPKLSYMDAVIKKWKKNNIKSPSQLQAYQEEYEKLKKQKGKKQDKLETKPTYDLEQIKRDALNNTEI